MFDFIKRLFRKKYPEGYDPLLEEVDQSGKIKTRSWTGVYLDEWEGCQAYRTMLAHQEFKIARMRRAGLSDRAISRKLGKSPSYVSNLVYEGKIPARGRYVR